MVYFRGTDLQISVMEKDINNVFEKQWRSSLSFCENILEKFILKCIMNTIKQKQNASCIRSVFCLIKDTSYSILVIL